MYNYSLPISLDIIPNILIITSVVCSFFALICKFTLFYLNIRSEYSLLEIIPPHSIKQSPLATEQFLTTLHALGKQRNFVERLFGKKKLIALEIVSSKEHGIRYLMHITTDDIAIIKKHILAFLPGVTVNLIDDYLLTSVNRHWRTVSMRLSKQFSLPLQEQKHLAQHDPIAYITGQMTKLDMDEQVVVQFILTPANYTNLPWSASKIIHLGFTSILFLLFTPLTFLGWLIFQDKKEAFPLWLFKTKAQGKKAVEDKVNKELFETTIRLYVAQHKKKTVSVRLNGLLSAFASFRNENHQELSVKRLLLIEKLLMFKRFYYLQMKHRLLSLTQNPLLSVSEVASLFHFPYAPTTQTEDLVHTKSKKLPAPLSLKQKNRKLDSIFAQNIFAETKTSIGLLLEERRRHVYILGATGMGKTALLATMIRKDIANGKGVCVIDPHGNLIEQIVSEIPKVRLKDTILFDPDDTDFPIGLNLLALPKNVTDKELQRQKEFITSNLISIIMKLYPPRFTGPRMEYILRNTTLTALETENPTLFTIQKLLVDNTYRKHVVAKLKNPALILFWTKEFAQMGSYQKSEAVAPITNKIGKFITSSLSANILGQKESKLDFSDVLDNGKILLCDLSKGKIGEDFSNMFGALITAGVQLAALKRARIREDKRRDFYLYIDEFQNFANSSFAQIMSEARKYRLNAILAHQTIAQIEDHNLVKVILANTGSIICFRTGSPLDEEFILPFFAPQVEKGEISNLAPYNFYMKINNDTPQDSFSGETIYTPHSINDSVIERIKSLSRKNYAMTKEQIEQEIQQDFFAGVTSKKKQKIYKHIKKDVLPEEQIPF